MVVNMSQINKLMLLVFLTRLCNCQKSLLAQSKLYDNATEEIAPESEHVPNEKYMCTDSLQCSEMEEGEPKFCHFNTEGHSWGYCVKCSDVHQFGCSYHADKNGHHTRWEEECKDVCESVNNVCEDDENNNMEIMCPEHQVILIFSISFGRLNSHICPKNETEEDSEKDINTSCVSEFSWPVAFQKCMGMQNCTLVASVEEFGDPCPGTAKYLSVSHTCRPKACENSLICGKGGFCNDEKMGFCEFCSDLNGSCSDQKNLTTFALEECQATCEGKYTESCENAGISTNEVPGKIYIASGLLWIIWIKGRFF